MAHVKRAVTAKKRHKKILNLAKGYRGRAKNCFRIAIEKVEKALQYAYRDRRTKKETSENYGFKELMQLCVLKELNIHNLLMA